MTSHATFVNKLRDIAGIVASPDRLLNSRLNATNKNTREWVWLCCKRPFLWLFGQDVFEHVRIYTVAKQLQAYISANRRHVQSNGIGSAEWICTHIITRLHQRSGKCTRIFNQILQQLRIQKKLEPPVRRHCLGVFASAPAPAGCVGFGNQAANCWANALLQMFMHSDERREVLRTIGTFYAQGESLGVDAAIPVHLRCSYGNTLLRILEQYFDAVDRDRTVPSDVSQQLRTVLNQLSGGRVCRAVAGHFEDVHESINWLMNRYYAILRSQQSPLPPLFFTLTSTIHINPIGMQRLHTAPNRGYLPSGHLLHLPPSVEHHIFLAVPRTHNHSIEELLETNLHQDNRRACYAVNASYEREYQADRAHSILDHAGSAPHLLTLYLKRWVNGQHGHQKNNARVITHRVIILPADATPLRQPLAYELESFIVHRPGHYVAYRKMGNQWVEFNDSRTRALSAREIDNILSNNAGGGTPYVLDYRLVPPEGQEAAQARVLQLRQARPSRGLLRF